jgi:hypothetical protein
MINGAHFGESLRRSAYLAGKKSAYINQSTLLH